MNKQGFEAAYQASLVKQAGLLGAMGRGIAGSAKGAWQAAKGVGNMNVGDIAAGSLKAAPLVVGAGLAAGAIGSYASNQRNSHYFGRN